MRSNSNLSDKASVLFNISYAIGASIAPIIGGGLCEKLGYQSTSNVMSAVAMIAAFIYFVLAIVPRLCNNQQ